MNYYREENLNEALTWDYNYESGNDMRRDPFHEHFVR